MKPFIIPKHLLEKALADHSMLMATDMEAVATALIETSVELEFYEALIKYYLDFLESVTPTSADHPMYAIIRDSSQSIPSAMADFREQFQVMRATNRAHVKRKNVH
jgi:hypothetical protein